MQPAQKLLRVIKGTTFVYPFQYLSGSPTSSTPINLTGYTATWSINWTQPSVGNVQYTLQAGVAANTSGVFFGGPTHDLTTGLITLVIGSAATSVIPWTTATHQFAITDPSSVTLELINGGIGVVGSFPS